MNSELDAGLATETATSAESQPSGASGQTSQIGDPDLNALLAALEHQRISALAYFFWEQRGCPCGSPEEDWYRAEQEIRNG